MRIVTDRLLFATSVHRFLFVLEGYVRRVIALHHTDQKLGVSPQTVLIIAGHSWRFSCAIIWGTWQKPWRYPGSNIPATLVVWQLDTRISPRHDLHYREPGFHDNTISCTSTESDVRNINNAQRRCQVTISIHQLQQRSRLTSFTHLTI